MAILTRRILSTVSLLAMVFLLAACHQSVPVKSHAFPPQTKTTYVPCPKFTKVDVEGPFVLEFRDGCKHNQFTVIDGTHYDAEHPTHIAHWVKNDTLYVRLDKNQANGPNNKVKIIIEAPVIQKITLNGIPKAKIDRITKTHTFTLDAANSGTILAAGNVRRFNATLSDKTKLNAKCLYAHTIFINTVDFAQAEVFNRGGLSALAANRSNIYYYEDPKLVAGYQRLSGSVIRMNGLPEHGNMEDIFPPQIRCPSEAVHGYG